MQANPSFFILGFTAVSLSLWSIGPKSPARAAEAVKADGWEPSGSYDDGLVLYQKQVEGSPIVAFKGVGTVDAPISVVTGVLIDHARASEWVDRLAEFRMIKQITPLEYLDYTHIKMPLILKDRDFVTRVNLSVNPADKSVIMQSGSVSAPEAPTTDFVRGDLVRSYFVLKPVDAGKKTLVSAEFHADPKGSIPKWIVNLFQKNWPKLAFSGIKKQVAKTDLKPPHGFESLISQVSGFEK